MKKRITLRIFWRYVNQRWACDTIGRKYKRHVLNDTVTDWCEETLGYIPILRHYPRGQFKYLAEFENESDLTLFLIRFPRKDG